jgi:hypothetical protein
VSRPGRALPPGKEPPVPIGREAGWAPEPVWTQKLEKKSSASSGVEPRSSSPQSDTILTELPKLKFVAVIKAHILSGGNRSLDGGEFCVLIHWTGSCVVTRADLELKGKILAPAGNRPIYSQAFYCRSRLQSLMLMDVNNIFCKKILIKWCTEDRFFFIFPICLSLSSIRSLLHLTPFV